MKISLAGNSDDDFIMDVKGKGKEIIRSIGTSTPIKTKPSAVELEPFNSPIVSLDSDSDDDIRKAASSSKKPKANSTTRISRPFRFSSSPDVSDAKPTIKTDLQPEDNSDLEIVESGAQEQDDDLSIWVTRARELQEKNKDVAVNFALSARMEGTVPLVARRRLGQEVKLLLDTWIAHQYQKGYRFPEDVQTERLFLTWNLNKVYSHSSAASLGVELNPEGTIKNAIGPGYYKGGLFFEVWTEELYAECIRDRDRERALQIGDDDSEMGAEDMVEEEAPVKKTSIVLKAKQLEPLETKIRPDTTVEALIKEFRSKRAVNGNTEIAIYFDGEKLEEDSLVQDADLDPDDVNQLEVHIR